MTRWLKRSVVALTGLVMTMHSAFAADEERATISVSGVGHVSAVPDIADIQVGVQTQAQTAQAALEQNNKTMNSLYAALKEKGVAAKDIQTSQMQVHPQYSQPNRAGVNPAEEFIPRVVGYRVTNMVTITARDIPKLGPLLDTLINVGANQIHGISFRIEKPEKLLDQARKQAVADAKAKAELLAGEAGVILGAPFRISEESGGRPPTPRAMGRMAMMAEAAPMPISAGEQELSISVNVVYELKLPER